VDSDSELLKRVEYYGWILTSVLTVVALVARYPLVASGCALGGTLSVLHFKWLAMFLSAILNPQRRPYSRIKTVALGAYLVKYLIITGVVYVLFHYGVVEPWGFLGGLSVIFVAICVAGLVRVTQLKELRR
jgi:ATP synthase I subunit